MLFLPQASNSRRRDKHGIMPLLWSLLNCLGWRFYTHGAPDGAWALPPVDDACKVQRGRAHSVDVAHLAVRSVGPNKLLTVLPLSVFVFLLGGQCLMALPLLLRNGTFDWFRLFRVLVAGYTVFLVCQWLLRFSTEAKAAQPGATPIGGPAEPVGIPAVSKEPPSVN
jgi:hypothetical protein